MSSTMIEQLRREYIAGLRRHLTALDTERTQVLSEIALAERGLGLTPTTAIPPIGAAIPPTPEPAINVKRDEFRGLTTDAAIKKLLSWGTPLSAPAIADLLFQGGLGTDAKAVKANVYSALKRLREKEIAVRGTDGLWLLIAATNS
jgi:hypothetical protein